MADPDTTALPAVVPASSEKNEEEKHDDQARSRPSMECGDGDLASGIPTKSDSLKRRIVTRERWLARYKQRFIEVARLTETQAQACAEAESFEVLSECFEDDPEDAADEEMSYWEG